VYIKGNRTFVNLDAVEHVEPVSSRGGQALKLTTRMNHELGIVADVDLERLTAKVISAGPVTTMLCITPTGEVTAAPIAGWRVLRTGLEPLHVIEPPAGATRFLVVGGQGLVRLDDGVMFAGIDQAKAAVVGGVHPDQAPAPGPAPVEQPTVVGSPPKLAAGGRRGTR
jgi:hypothetical protein